MNQACRSVVVFFFLLGLLGSVPVQASLLESPTIGGSFGVQVKHDRASDEDLDRIRSAGFGRVRFDMRWRDIEKTRGVYSWDYFDRFMSRLRARGLGSVIVLFGGNPAYSDMIDVPPEKFWGNAKITPAPTTPNAIEGFARFAAAAADRYKKDNIIWEIWNEPDAVGFWPPKPDPEAYASLASATCQSIREHVPVVTVIASGQAQIPSFGAPGTAIAAAFLKSNAATCVDGFSMHTYRLTKTPETLLADYEQARKYIVDHTPGGQKVLPIVNSEWGYTTVKVTPEQQADFVLRTHLTNLIAGVPLSVWYEWKDTPWNQPDHNEAHFGILDQKGKDKPAAGFIQGLLPRIAGAVLEKRVMLSDPSVFVVLVRHADGTRTLIAWIAAMDDAKKEILVHKEGGVQTYAITTHPILIDVGAVVPSVDLLPLKIVAP